MELEAKIADLGFSAKRYFLYNFFSITPYLYTYLNLFNKKEEVRYERFENDYWGASIKELIKKTKFKSDKLINFATCGVEKNIAKNYLKKNGYRNFTFENNKKADYVIITNRTISWNNKLTNCFQKYSGKNIYMVERNGLVLSAIRKNVRKSSQ